MMTDRVEYVSTRGGSEPRFFSRALLSGIAEDGGLFSPDKVPTLSATELSRLRPLKYWQRAFHILRKFNPDMPDVTLGEMTRDAYGSNFDSLDVAPVVSIGNRQYMQELWHGPSGAFKDMALQIMPLMFEEACAKDNRAREAASLGPLRYFVIGTTSGDTGAAAIEGYKNKRSLSIAVFYPRGKVSRLQELMMTTQDGNNVFVGAMEGDFDAIQRAAKETFADKEFNDLLLDQYGVVLSSANSINWGRIVPQIAYHVSAYVDLLEKGVIEPGDKIDIAVPTGNFGNILSAFYAKQMGVPINKLVCASNENNVLTAFLQTGIYDIRERSMKQTPSPSMDILVSSNVERLLYEITRDPVRVYRWMEELKTNKVFKVDEDVLKRLHEDFYAGWVENDECLQNIKDLFERKNYLMDTHTSVAHRVAQEYQEQNPSNRPLIISSTAHWAKFPRDIRKALLGSDANQIIADASPEETEFSIISQIMKLVPNATVPQSIATLQAKPERFAGVADAESEWIKRAILSYLQPKAA
ncbi:threonine synthase [Candidatus Curtissbacteria bacterium]|nr:threonine synthase [Candidatus Curtissbacteria bacterium]